ncbi:hypothetical protein EGM85_11720, partial [Macrococcus caseolyticus]
LSLHDLISSELDTVDKSIVSLAANVSMLRLAEERHNRGTGVTSDNRNELVLRICILDLRNKTRSTDKVESCNTEHTLRVVNAQLLQSLSDDGNGRVDRVGDDSNESLGADLASSLCEITNNGRISVEQVIAGHTKLEKWNANVRIGGKGTPRRKIKRSVKTDGDDTKVQAALQKLNAQTLTGVEQVNLFKEDGINFVDSTQTIGSSSET